MLIQVCFLSEACITIRSLTYIRSFLGVNAKMIKEIMPFSEDLTAAIVSTKEHSDYPSRVDTFMFENHVLFGIRHMFHYSNVLQFKRLVIKHENRFIFLNCFIVFEVTCEVKVVPLKDFFRTVIC